MINKLLPGLRKNILLKNYTTFRIGGPAKYFYTAKDKDDLIKAIKTAKKLKLPFFVLGGGSNILVADKGYNGLVIKVKSEKLKVKNYRSKFKVICEGGVILTKLVSKSIEIGAMGMEWAVGIPGITVGGAIRGNAGAFEQSMSNIVKKVEVLEVSKVEPPEEVQPFKIKNKDCKFKYRDSIFKHNKNLIILSAEIELKKGNKEEIKKRVRENLKWRKDNQPLNFPSAGSIFKNPRKYSAGWLIEKCGLKGKKINKAQISKKHANFIVNLDNAKSQDVIKLINLAKKKVKKKFDVNLKEEIEYLE